MTPKKSNIPVLVQNELTELFDIIDNLFVSHFVTIHGINFYIKNYIPKLKKQLSQDANASRTPLTDTYKKTIHIGDEDATQSIVYQTTFEQVISIAETPGHLENKLAGNLVVTIYQYWDDTYRGKIADLLGLKKDDLKADIWGDLRHIRRSVLHRKFTAVDEIINCKIIKSFASGQLIIFDYSILNDIKNELHNWYNEFMYNIIQTYIVKPSEQPVSNL